MEARAKEERGRSEGMEWRSVSLNEKFTSVGKEISEEERFEGKTTKGARKEEGVGGSRGSREK